MDSKEVDDFLEGKFKEWVTDRDVDGVWIGAKRKESDSPFYWTDGEYNWCYI